MPSRIADISHTGHHIPGQRALDIAIPLLQIGIWIMFVHHKRSNDGGSIKGREQGRDWCWLRDSVAENLRQEVRWIRHQELKDVIGSCGVVNSESRADYGVGRQAVGQSDSRTKIMFIPVPGAGDRLGFA